VFLGNGAGSFLAPVEYRAGPYPIQVIAARLRGANAPGTCRRRRRPGRQRQLSDHGPAGQRRRHVRQPHRRRDAALQRRVDGRRRLQRRRQARSRHEQQHCAAGRNFKSPQELSILIGNGDGTFQAPVPYVAGEGTSYFYDMAVADFNATASSTSWAWTDRAVLSIGVGDGTFRPSVLTWSDRRPTPAAKSPT